MNKSATYSNSNLSLPLTAAELDTAYHQTTYLIRPSSAKLPLRIGEQSPELEQSLEKSQCQQWAFISAVNPGSQRLSEAANANRHRQLLSMVSALKLPYHPGDGVPDSPGWPIEPGLFICGISLEKALEIGRYFDQFAILVGEGGSPPRLHYCDSNYQAKPITEVMHGF